MDDAVSMMVEEIKMFPVAMATVTLLLVVVMVVVGVLVVPL